MGIAIAREEPIVPAEVVIDAGVEGMGVVVVEPIDRVVVVQAGLGRFRIRLHQPEGVRVEPAHRDDVVGERVPHEAGRGSNHPGHRIELSGRDRTGRGGIEDRAARKRSAEEVGADGSRLQRDEVRIVGKPARPLERRRHRPDPRARLLDQAALVVREPERLVGDRGSTGREPELVRQVVTFLDVGAIGEEIVGVHRIVPVELPHRPTQLVRS